MSEFEQKDYESARSNADSIKTIADSISCVFDDIDATMKTLYGEDWQSSGADVSEGRYMELRKNYEVFYNNVVAMHDHVYNVTASNESTDASVGASISGI